VAELLKGSNGISEDLNFSLGGLLLLGSYQIVFS
jgi:hypothetical protein